MKKRVLNLLIFIIFVSINAFGQGGASSCAELAANPGAYQSCATSIPFSSSVGGNGENFNSTCIPTQYVGPTWFFIEIDTPGNVVLQISQRNLAGNGTDVDFVLWGPFQNLNNICNQLNTTTEVDCSYSGASLETVTIPNSNAGDLYVIVIDNYSGQAGNITVSQTGGSGSTNCDFLSSVSLNNTDGSLLTNLDYCKPDTKEIVATIDISDFPGVPSNLRFNYTWFKDNVQIDAISNSTISTNGLIVSESGVYKVIGISV